MDAERPTCLFCAGSYSVELYPDSRPGSEATVYEKFSCTYHESREYGRIYHCLQCGLVFQNSSLDHDQIEDVYKSVEDPTYRENIHARYTTFRHNLAQASPPLPQRR